MIHWNAKYQKCAEYFKEKIGCNFLQWLKQFTCGIYWVLFPHFFLSPIATEKQKKEEKKRELGAFLFYKILC